MINRVASLASYWPSRRQWAAFGVAYAALTQLGVWLNIHPSQLAVFAPLNGLLLAALLVSPPRQWWAFTLTAFPISLFMDIWLGHPLTMSFLFWSGHALSAWLGAALVRRHLPPFPAYSTTRYVLSFAGYTALLGALPNTLFSMAATAFTPDQLNPVTAFGIWWSGHALGVLLVAPIVLTAIDSTKRVPHWSVGRWAEAGLVLCGIITTAGLAYGFHDALPIAHDYTVIPFLLWAALRFGPSGAALTNGLVATIVIWFTVHGQGEFVTGNQLAIQDALSVQTYLITISMATLLLAAGRAESATAQTALAQLNTHLEEQVQHRTQQLESTVVDLKRENAERRKVEAALRVMEASLAERVVQQSRQLAGLYEVILVAGQSLDMTQSLGQALSKVALVVEGVAASIHLLTDNPTGWQLSAHLGLTPAEQRLVAWLEDGSAPTDIECWNGHDAPPAPYSPLAACFRQLHFEAFIAIPIRFRAQTIGALTMCWAHPRSFAVEDMALFTALADQLGVIVENARLRHDYEESVVLRERRRLARDLHDSVTQSLHSLVLGAYTASRQLQQQEYALLGESLSDLSDSARQTVKEMRLLLYEMRLAQLEEVNLAEALQTRLEAVEQRAGIRVELEVSGEARWPDEWERDVYPIATEVLNNALKHARATAISVRLHGAPNLLELTISDDGLGFDLHNRPGGGMGLQTMVERAERLDGSLTITSVPGAGTSVYVRIPAVS